MVEIGLFDWVIWLTYLILIGLILYIYKNTRSDQQTYRYFLPAFLLKVFGGLAFALIYVYYYRGGDTIGYFMNSQSMVDILFNDPGDYFRMMFSEAGNFAPDLVKYSDTMGYSRGQEEWFAVRTLSVFSLVGFNSFVVTTLLISFVSFLCMWKFFLVLKEMVSKKWIAYLAVFLAPSAVFWGSGILKDTLVMATMSLFIWSIYRLFFQKKWSFWLFIVMFLSAFLSFKFKSYVLFLFMPSVIFGIFLVFRQNIRISLVRYFLTPLLIAGSIYFGFLGVVYMADSSSKYELSGIEGKVKGFHSWHAYQGGSVYDLGEVEYTTQGILSKVPAAINVTLFRPYPWEVNNFVMALGALESFVLLFLFLRLLTYKYKKIRWIFKDPFFVMMFIYIILLGFTVGFTSYNFGALARYKIPILSMFTFMLVALNFDERLIPSISRKTESSDQA